MKILIVATVQSHICQFYRPLVQMLHDHGCEVHVAARDNLAEKNGLKLDFADRVFDVPFERSPFNKRNLTAYKQLKKIVDDGNYDAVHTNTPVGGIVGRLAARKARKSGCKVIYTAHGFHFFKGGSIKSWLIYYPIERFMCRYTDLLITINDEDYALAKAHFKVQTEHIHGIGANSEKYRTVWDDAHIALKKRLGYEDTALLLCTGELNANKNQVTAIRAMPGVVKNVPNAKLLLAGNGPLVSQLEDEVKRLGMTDFIELLGYKTNLQEYVNAADLIVSCSRREGLPVNIIEGMLCEKAVVASINRGHKELVEDGVTGYLLPSDDPQKFSEKIAALLIDPKVSHEMGRAGKEKAAAYTDKAVYRELEQVYRSIGVI